MTIPEIVVNVRTLKAPATGVQRYTKELVDRLDQDGHLERVAPAHAVRGVTGHLWEQLALPLHVRGRLLWSPGGTGPWWLSRHVVTIHDAAAFDHPEWFQEAYARWYRFVQGRLLATARRIATVSEFSRRRLLAYVPEAEPRLRVTPLAAGPEFRPASADAVADARRRLGLPSGYVLAVGTLQPRKNIARLLDAWAALGDRTDGLTLAVAGARSNPIFAPTELPALPPRTVLLGYVDDPDLPALYTGARAFVFPSLYEGFGLPVLEAMACGAPVIAANAGAPADLLADGAGVLVDPLDTRSIATGLAAVLEDDARRERLRAAGFERAGTFSWERTAAETRELLRDALGWSTTGEA